MRFINYFSKPCILLTMLLFLSIQVNFAQNHYTISTIAGNGTAGFFGDGGDATSAQIQNPSEVKSDNTGNLYIADFNNHRIRKVDAITGIITTVAGNGTGGFSGDGGAAISAQLNGPLGVAIDTQGNVYIVDSYNHRIRKVDAITGIITTIAGNGISGLFGDGGVATVAQLNNPHGAEIDAQGNVYIADYANHRIRKVDAVTGIITTIAGNGPGGFSGDGGAATTAQIFSPRGIDLDNNGNIYIADYDNHRVRKVNPTTGIITTIAGNGVAGFSGDGSVATAAQFNHPRRVAVDSNGNLYISDYLNQRIRRVEVTTGIITTIAGNGISGFSGDGGGAIFAQFSVPTGVAVDDNGNIYVGDYYNNRIRKLTPDPPLSTNKYQLSSPTINCRDTTFCIWLQAKTTVDNGIIGLDYCLEYDTNVLEPTGNVTLGEVVNNGGNAYGAYKINSNTSGRLHASVFYQSSAPANIQFTGSGNVICIEFRLKPGATHGQTVLKSCEISEAHALYETNQATDSSTVNITEEIYKFKGRLVYWNNQHGIQPLGYDTANPGNHQITNIFGNSAGCNSLSGDSVQTDLNGYFIYDTRNGNRLSIKRDIPANAPDMMQVINGMDCYYAALITTFDTQDSSGNWTPTAAQMLAADVNMNSKVRSNDITLMQQRILLKIAEYPQKWNYDILTGQPLPPALPSLDWRFYDAHTTPGNPDFSPAANYPVFPGQASDGGFWRDKVPGLAQCVPVEPGTICDTDSTKNLYYSVLLGDVDGNWRSGTSNHLRTTGETTGELVIDLFNAEKLSESAYKIPVYHKHNQAIHALDFSFHYQANQIQVKRISRSAEGETAGFQMDWNNYQNQKILLTSYSVKGSQAQTPVYYMEIETTNGQKPNKDMFDSFAGYLNGRVSKTQVIKTAEEFNQVKGLGIVGVYPNPVVSEVTVSYSNIQKDTPQLLLTDSQGRNVPIHPTVTEDGKIKFGINHLANGTYLLTVVSKSGKTVATKRLVVQH